MSLIQDALKRKSEEQPATRATMTPIPPPPATPTVAPTVTPTVKSVVTATVSPIAEITEPAADKKSIQPLFIILSFVMIVVLTALGIYLIKPKSKPVPPVAQVPATAAPAPVAPVVLQPAAVPEPPAVAVETAKVETVKVEAVIEPVKKEEPAPVIPVVWPELKLTGIAQSDSQSIAVINGKMLSVGRTLGTVTVKEVNENNAVVECQGERRILYIGE